MGFAEMIKGSLSKFAERLAPPMGETAAMGGTLASGLNLLPYNPDDLVRSKSKGLRLYQEMVREPYIKAALLQKKTRLLKVGWEVVPYSKDPAAVEMAAFVRWNLETKLAGAFSKDLYEFLDSLDNGFSVSEKVYAVEERGQWKGRVVLQNIKSKDPCDFDFQPDEYGNLGADGLLLNSGFGQRKNLRVDKFVIFSHLMKYENYYGTSDLRAAYRAFWLKDTAWKLRAIYMERYSGNNLKGTYPKNDPKAKEALLEIFRTWQQETGIALPEGVEVEVLNLATSPKSEYESTINDCNREIQIGILGQTLTMDVGEGGTGSRALGQVHDGVRDDYVWFLDEMLTAEVNLQIVRPLIDYNYETDNYPWWSFKSREGFDTEAFSRTIINLGKVKKLNIPVWWVKEKYRIPEPDPGEEVVEISDPAPAQSSSPQRFAEDASPFSKGGQRGIDSFKEKPDGPYWRPLDRFEVFSELPRIDMETAALITEAKAASVAVYDSIRDDILSQVRRKALLDDGDYAAIEKISPNAGGLKQLLTDTILKANLMGRADIARLASSPAAKHAEDYVPDAALAALARKAGMTKAAFERLLAEIKGRAFTIAGLELAAIEKEAKTLLLQAIKNGDDIKAFRFRLNESFIKYSMPVYGGVGAPGDAVLDYHAENIFRTNIMDAYNQGRKEALSSEPVMAEFPAWQYSAILDGRTRDTHAAMDGKVFMADDPVWERITPSNGYNCRCTIVPVNKYDFTRDMLASSAEIPGNFPDSGFG